MPYLEGLGLRLCLEDRDFRIGASRVDEIDRAVTQSRYTVAVFTPSYLAAAVDNYEALLAAYSAIESHTPRFMPLQRLAVSLRQAPRPQLTT